MAWKFYDRLGQLRQAGYSGPATPGWQQISDTILSASAATIDLTSIPATYRHLRVITSLRTDVVATSASALTRFNNDSGANYWDENVQASAGATSASENNAITSINALFGAIGTTGAASGFWDVDAMIYNYARTDRIKNVTVVSSIPVGLTTGQHIPRLAAATWNSTAAINRITFSLASGNYVAGSTVTLYGIT